jgi:hypothetical protein
MLARQTHAPHLGQREPGSCGGSTAAVERSALVRLPDVRPALQAPLSLINARTMEGRQRPIFTPARLARLTTQIGTARNGDEIYTSRQDRRFATIEAHSILWTAHRST